MFEEGQHTNWHQHQIETAHSKTMMLVHEEKQSDRAGHA